MVEFRIDEVYPKTESYPLLTHFQNGYPAADFQDQKSEVLEHKVTGKKCVAAEINDLLYVGEECDEPLGKTLVLARNRKTGKVRLIEVGNIELQPILTSNVESSELQTSYVDLGRKFGSKKHKKMLEQNEKLKVNEEVVMEQLKDVSVNVSQDQLDLTSYNKTDSAEFYIPPQNPEAKNVEDVYILTSILTTEQFETIYNEIESYPKYINEFHPCIKDIVSESWSPEQTVLAVFASSLLNMHTKIMRDLKLAKFAACPYSATLDKIILKEFFTYSSENHVPSTRLRPQTYKDKALCHAIVFIFLINNYKLDIELFCKNVKIVERTASTKLYMTGAWVVKQGSKKVAVLKLPLNKGTTGFSRRKSAKF